MSQILDEAPATQRAAAIDVSLQGALRPFNDDDRQMEMWLLDWGWQQITTRYECIRNLQQKLTQLCAAAAVGIGLWLTTVAGGPPPAQWWVVAPFGLAGLCFAAVVAIGLSGWRVVEVETPADAADWWAYLMETRAGTVRQGLLLDFQKRVDEAQRCGERWSTLVTRAGAVLAAGLGLAILAGGAWFLAA